MEREVNVQVDDRVMVVTLNRPAVRNAVTQSVAEAVAAALDELDASDQLAVGVITGQVARSAPAVISKRPCRATIPGPTSAVSPASQSTGRSSR
jgi:enoyl-CoA hydratase